MAKKGGMESVGKWAFFIGMLLAVILGLFGSALGTGLSETGILVLAIIGLIVGLFNVADKEVTPFLMSGVVLIIASALGGSIMGDIPYVGSVLDALLAVFVPATVIVAVKNVFSLARN